MKKNDLLKNNDNIIRILDINNENVLIIDCIKRTVPKWFDLASLNDYILCEESALYNLTGNIPLQIEDLEPKIREYAYKRYTLIAAILPFISDDKERCYMTRKIANQNKISIQTVKNTLCLYLSFQNMAILAPKPQLNEKALTDFEKNIRWALNKFYYTKRQNSLKTAYMLMLKERYCDKTGELVKSYPSIHQFRYFYRKYRKIQTYYISRYGLKAYQRNNRPLIGDGIREFAPAVGVGMFDSTICDIYLINESGNLVGRPILTACIDAYSGLCLGYSLSWEGGVYSIRTLLLNIITNKVELCRKFGIIISKKDWDSSGILPGVFVTDKGSEYKSENFEQIAELGVTIVNLSAYRPELKGAVEKFFDVIQNLYKPHLKGKGIIEPDFRERGSHDYRQDACLTIKDFEKVLLYCIIHYNSKNVIENFPYTDDMIKENIKPYASEIWKWNKNKAGANLIPVNKNQLILTLLPRTTGTFTRQGLKVNKLRYHCEGYTEQYLTGGIAMVAYNPDNVSEIWLIEKGNYINFSLIDSRFKDKSLDECESLKKAQRQIIMGLDEERTQAEISLIKHIEAISENAIKQDNVCVKSVRETRKKEQTINHVDIMSGGVLNDN